MQATIRPTKEALSRTWGRNTESDVLVESTPEEIINLLTQHVGPELARQTIESIVKMTALHGREGYLLTFDSLDHYQEHHHGRGVDYSRGELTLGFARRPETYSSEITAAVLYDHASSKDLHDGLKVYDQSRGGLLGIGANIGFDGRYIRENLDLSALDEAIDRGWSHIDCTGTRNSAAFVVHQQRPVIKVHSKEYNHFSYLEPVTKDGCPSFRFHRVKLPPETGGGTRVRHPRPDAPYLGIIDTDVGTIRFPLSKAPRPASSGKKYRIMPVGPLHVRAA